MPWSETDAMKERVKFVLEWERRWNEGEGRVNVSELCRVFGVTRDTGYRWIQRFRAGGHRVDAVAERSRRPKSNPTATAEEVQDVIVQARKVYPKWGPRKLRVILCERCPQLPIPSTSAIAGILKRRGMTRPRARRRRQPVVASTTPFATCDRPNATWCVDFKGWFRTKDGKKCHPLTVLDAHSRFSLRCEIVADPTGKEVERVFDSAFQEFGLPGAIRSDNGPPFASTGAGGLTRLSVWWIQLGIRLERIAPGKPQQNGRHERMHLTLLQEALDPPAANPQAQQRAFDLWRRTYNEERPHEAIAMKRPSQLYERSSTSYPRPLKRPDYSDFTRTERVDKTGHIRWQHRNKVFISMALAHEEVAIEPANDRYWDVSYGAIHLGRIDGEQPDRGLIVPRRSRSKVSGMSLY